MHFAKRLVMNKGPIKIHPYIWIVLSIALLFIPFRWFISWIIAATIHELFHIIALRMCNFEIKCFRIGPSGACIEADMKPGIKMAFCALAGPLSGFILLLFVHRIPRIAICGLLQSLCNMLPVYPLDGSRIFRGVLSSVFNEDTANFINGYLEKTVIILLCIVSCYATFRLDLGLMPLILMLVLFAKKKHLANQAVWRYNTDNRNDRGNTYDRTATTNFTNRSKAGTVYWR